MSNSNQRSQLRQSLRHARNALTPEQQANAALALKETCLELTAKHSSFALYLSNDGEINPTEAITALWQQEKTVALPVLHPLRKGYLNFQQFSPTTALPLNKYKIPEPKIDATEIIPLPELDIIFMPLVGFDHHGNRLGMGGGYYDRTLARLNTLTTRPTLVGLAHDCQQVEQLPNQPWDVPLDLIITPTQKIVIKGNA